MDTRKKHDQRIRHLFEGKTVDQQDTDDLINRFSKSQIEDLHHLDETPTKAHGIPRNNWESTTDILKTDLNDLDQHALVDVSDRTMLIGHNQQLLTPIRRSVSGSSLDTVTSMDSIQHKRTASVPNYVKQIDFELFFGLLEEVLPHQKYQHFKGILLKYLEIIQEHEIDPSSDQFIITIYNQLRYHNASLDKLKKIIAIFVTKPSSEALKLANFLYFQDHSLKTRFLKLWIVKRRKFNELNKSSQIWELYLKRKYFESIKVKYEFVTDDLVINSDLMRDTKSLMAAFTTWRISEREQRERKVVADLQVGFKFLKRWKLSYNRVIDDEIKAGVFYNDNLIKSKLQLWRLNTTSKKQKTLKPYLKVWSNSLSRIRAMERDSRQLETIFHGGFFFTKIKEKSQVIATRTRDLDRLCDELIKLNFFHKWTTSLKYRSIEHRVIDKRNHLIGAYAINKWKNRSQQLKVLEELELNKNQTLLRKFLIQWRHQVVLTDKCLSFEKENVTRSLLHRWKLITFQRLYQNDKDVELSSIIFQNWSKQVHLNELLRTHQIKFISIYFNSWNDKMHTLENQADLGSKAYVSYSKVVFLSNWKKSYIKVKDDGLKADQMIMKRYFKHITLKKAKLIQMDETSHTYRINDTSAALRRQMFKKWVAKHEEVREAVLEEKLQEYQININKPKVSIILGVWADKLRSYEKQLQLFNKKVLRDITLRPIFENWIISYNDITELEDRADKMNKLNLMSSGFTKIQVKLFQIGELETKQIEYQEDSDWNSVLKHLRAWNLKTLKVRRDNENIATFRKRWTRAHLRAILLLWSGKALERQYKVHDTGSEFYEDDDDSPTKFKSAFDRSRLSTPRKPPIENADLQQSRSTNLLGSERIKRKRIEALKSRYSQIKYAIPSPLDRKKLIGIKNVSSQSSTKKLNFRSTRDSIPRLDALLNDDLEYDKFNETDDEPLSSPIISHKTILGRYKNSDTSNLF